MEQGLPSLPNGWHKKQLGDVVKLSQGTQVPVGDQYLEQEDGLIRFLRISDFVRSDEPPRYILNPGSQYLVEADDICMIRYGDAGRAVTGLAGALANNLFKISPIESLLKRFLFLQLCSPRCVDYLRAANNSSTMPAISFKAVNAMEVSVAPLDEQKRIVEKLDALLTRIDTAIEHLQESVTLADELYASELNEVFPSDVDIESLTDKDGWLSLSDICTFENGDRGKNYPSKSAFVAEGIPVVSAGNLGERYIDHKGLNYITPERYELLRSGRIRVGDILFCLRGSLGKVAISKDINEGVIASSLVIIRPKDQVSAEYIYKYLKSSLCQKFISYYNNGAAQPNLSAKSLGKFMLPLPNAEHQKLIVDGLDEKYQLNQKLLDGLNSKIISLQSLKASILDSAFKGEL